MCQQILCCFSLLCSFSLKTTVEENAMMIGGRDNVNERIKYAIKQEILVSASASFWNHSFKFYGDREFTSLFSLKL